MITTKNVAEPIGSKGPNKKLEPGNHEVSIVSIILQPNKFDRKNKDSDHLMFILEGPDLGPGFEGFMRDKDDPSKGIHKGQTAWVKATTWAFSDGITKSGEEVKKEDKILQYIKSVCLQTGSIEWFDNQDGKHNTIQDFVKQFDIDKPFKDKKLNVCIAGSYYYKKGEERFLSCDLYFPTRTINELPFEAINTNPSKLMKFNEALHVKMPKESKSSENTSNEIVRNTTSISLD